MCMRAFGLVAGLACASPVFSQEVMQVDIDAMSTRADGPFSESFTGNLLVFNSLANPDLDGDARILDVLIDSVVQDTGGASAGEFSFEMTIDFVGGDIVDGSLTLSADATGSENSYSARLLPSTGGAILHIGGGTFVVGGLTFDGLWSTPLGTFLGVDVSPWGSVQPVPGRFAEIAYTPNARFEDADTDVDVFVLPAPATVALLGLAPLTARRRR